MLVFLIQRFAIVNEIVVCFPDGFAFLFCFGFVVVYCLKGVFVYFVGV